MARSKRSVARPRRQQPRPPTEAGNAKGEVLRELDSEREFYFKKAEPKPKAVA
jgi:hypothetical protein